MSIMVKLMLVRPKYERYIYKQSDCDIIVVIPLLHYMIDKMVVDVVDDDALVQ